MILWVRSFSDKSRSI